MIGNPYRTILMVLFAVSGALALIVGIIGLIAQARASVFDPAPGVGPLAVAQGLAVFAAASFLLWLAVSAIRWQPTPVTPTGATDS